MPPLPHERGSSPTTSVAPMARQRKRGKHSRQRAAYCRLLRPDFDRFQSQKQRRHGSADISSQEFASWSYESETAGFDRTILIAEDLALSAREAHSVIPRIGTLPECKPDGVWRLMYCQPNCIGSSHAQNLKSAAIAKLIMDHDVDGVALCEVGIDWDYGLSPVQLKDYLDPFMEREIKSTTSHNTHGPCISRAQRGGTGILLTHTMVEYARATEVDNRKLGRWSSWVISHNPSHRTCIVVAYCPGKNHQPKGPKTVYRQHMNYIYINNLNTTPYELFVADLSNQLKRWRSNGNRIILFMDANEHILRGPITRRLRASDIDLCDVSHTFWPTDKEPNTYIDGSLPIDGVFVSPDLDVTNFLSLSFHESVGDHRSMIIEITTASFIGKFQGNIVRPSSCRLTMRQQASVKNYNTEVDRQLQLHNISGRINTLHAEIATSTKPLSPNLINKCNNLHTQIEQIRMRSVAAEKY